MTDIAPRGGRLGGSAIRRVALVFRDENVTRQFAVVSLVVIALISLALSLVLSFYTRKGLLDREWNITADYVRTEVLYHLSAENFAQPWTADAMTRFRDFYAQAVAMPEIVRLKIYDASATVIWSDEPRLLRTRFPDNALLRTALGGRTVVNLETGSGKSENIYERGRFPQLVEVYVPIVFPGSDRVAGVIETYKAPTQVFANIRQAQMVVFATAAAGGAFLYLVLYGIVRRAARRIREQREAIEQRNRELERRGLELAATNEDLRALQAQLVEAERMAAIGEVVTAVAHGIRNPLANIRAAAEVASLKERTGSAHQNGAAMDCIVGEVDRLEMRLRELLQFVRPGERSRELVDLNAVAEESLRLLAGRLGKAGLTVDARLAPSLPPIRGEAVLLEQVFLGLLGNAVEATDLGGKPITVTTGAERSRAGDLRVYAEVTDRGAGIPEAAIPRIFTPFYTTKAQGTGLGLAIAKKFTEAYGGVISVTSRPQEGTTFRLEFPAIQAPDGVAP